MNSAQMPGFRPNVALLLVNSDGQLLICERHKAPGAWQFPQGGVDEGESVGEALEREVLEEIGLPPDSYEVLRSKGEYRYLFPPGVREKKKGDWEGQEQTYFLCRMHEDAPSINVDQKPKEFQDHKWIKPKNFRMKWLPEFKQEVYRAVMRDFFELEID